MTALVLTPSTPEFLAPYGQLVLPVPNGDDFGPGDAELSFEGAPPRFWVMAADYRQPSVHALARHWHCSQCLASADARHWWMVLAPPQQDYVPPDLATIRLFRIDPGVILKLHVGTWHAGPYFPEVKAQFFLLEKQDTNKVDFTEINLPEPLHFAFDTTG